MKLSKGNKKFIRKSIEVVIYILVGYFIYKKLGGNISQISLDDINFSYLIISVLIFSFHSIWNGLTWNYLIRESGEETEVSKQVSVYLRSYIMRYIPGNVVGIFSRGYLNREHGVPMVKSIWGWFIENILYLGIGILIGIYAVIGVDLGMDWVYILMGLTIAVGLVVVFKNDLLEKLFRKILLKRIPDSAKDEFTPLELSFRARVVIVGRYLIAWFLYSVSFLFVVASVGVNPLSDPFMLMAINSIAYSIGYLTLITPSGIGVREFVMVFLLGAVVGLSPDLSVIIAVLARIVFILGELAGFGMFYSFIFLKSSYDKRKNLQV